MLPQHAGEIRQSRCRVIGRKKIFGSLNFRLLDHRLGSQALALFLERVVLRTAPFPEHTDETESENQDQRPGEAGHLRVAARPSPKFLRRSNRLGEDRFIAQNTFQFIGQLLCRLVSPGRVLCQTLEANGVQVAGHAWIQQTQSDGFMVQNLEHHVKCGTTFPTPLRPGARRFGQPPALRSSA